MLKQSTAYVALILLLALSVVGCTPAAPSGSLSASNIIERDGVIYMRIEEDATAFEIPEALETTKKPILYLYYYAGGDTLPPATDCPQDIFVQHGITEADAIAMIGLLKKRTNDRISQISLVAENTFEIMTQVPGKRGWLYTVKKEADKQAEFVITKQPMKWFD